MFSLVLRQKIAFLKHENTGILGLEFSTNVTDVNNKEGLHVKILAELILHFFNGV